MAKRETSHV